jgi:hypothetical protein
MNWRVKIIRLGVQFEMWLRAPTRLDVMRIIETVSARHPEEPIQIVSIREDNIPDRTD